MELSELDELEKLTNDVHVPISIIKDGELHAFQEVAENGKKKIVEIKGDAPWPFNRKRTYISTLLIKFCRNFIRLLRISYFKRTD
jgi:uncharacterized membrane protein